MSDMYRSNILKLSLSGLAVLGMALWLRYGLVELEELTLRCLQAGGADCLMRDTAIALFNQQRLGYFSLAAAVLSLIPRLRPLAWLGWGAGIAGLVLYCWDFSAPAVVLSLLVLARPAYASSRQSASQA